MSESSPITTLEADRTVIQPGEPVTVRWHVEGVKEVYFHADGEGWEGHGVAGVAEQQVQPMRTTAYRLRVVRLDDRVEIRGLEIQVQEQGRPLLTDVFSADKTEIRPGECVTFRWRVEGVKAVYFHAENQPWYEHGVAGVAEQQVCLDATTTCCLRVIGADDALAIHYVTVTVSP